MLRQEPLLDPRIQRCFQVPDGSADSFLGAHVNVESAREAGAQVLTYHKIERLLLSDREPQQVLGAVCEDLVSGEQVTILADLVVNAAGAWAGKIASTAGLEVQIIAGKGTMLAMNQRIVHTVINRCRMPSDGDILVPAHTVSVIGTTDVKVPDPDHFAIEPWEVNLCLVEGDKLVPGFKEMRMLRAWAGVRPLYQESGRTEQAADNRSVTRAFILLDHATRDGVDGIVTITSGKWTTYRKMAEATVDLVCHKLGVDRPCRTHLEQLPDPHKTGKHHALPARLAGIEVARAFGELICECELVTRSEVEEAILHAGAKTIDDIRRDVRLGMGPCQGGFCTFRAAGILHELQSTGGNQTDVLSTNTALRDFLQERWKGLLPV
jgi:glycerol-3-phosphate dehydrogenase